MSAVIETAELDKRYGSTLALDHVDLQVHRGEVFSFLGPSWGFCKSSNAESPRLASVGSW